MSDLDFSVEQPTETIISLVDGICIKSIRIPVAGTLVPQHSHVYDHVTMLAVGSMHVWAGDMYVGTFHAPQHLTIPGGVKHRFQSLTDGVVFFCIHNASRTGQVEELEQHELPGSPCAGCSAPCA